MDGRMDGCLQLASSNAMLPSVHQRRFGGSGALDLQQTGVADLLESWLAASLYDAGAVTTREPKSTILALFYVYRPLKTTSPFDRSHITCC